MCHLLINFCQKRPTHRAQTSHFEIHKHVHSISNRESVTEVKRICYCMCLWKEKKISTFKITNLSSSFHITSNIYSEQFTPSADRTHYWESSAQSSMQEITYKLIFFINKKSKKEYNTNSSSMIHHCPFCWIPIQYKSNRSFLLIHQTSV
jgi:hypothetical protein